MKSRFVQWLEERDDRLRIKYPRLWHLRTLHVIAFMVIATLLATALACAIPVTPRSIPRIEPGYFTLLAICAAATCAWLAALMRPMRWTELAYPYAAPRFSLAAVHLAALFLPALVYGSILEHRIKTTIPHEEAETKLRALEYHQSNQNDLANNYQLLKFKRIRPDEPGDNDKRSMTALPNDNSPALVWWTAEGDDKKAYEIPQIHLRGHSQFGPSFTSFKIIPDTETDSQANDYMECVSSGLVFQNMDATLLSGFSDWNDTSKRRLRFGKAAMGKIARPYLATMQPLFSEALKSELMQVTTVEGEAESEDDFEAIRKGECPPTYIQLPYEASALRIDRKIAKGSSTNTQAFVKFIEEIILMHCCEARNGKGEGPNFGSLGAVANIPDNQLSAIVDRVMKDFGKVDLVKKTLQKAIMAGKDTIAMPSHLRRFHPTLSAGRTSTLYAELTWFGSRFAQYLAIALGLTGLLILLSIRLIGKAVAEKALWASAAILGIAFIVLVYGPRTWVAILVLSTFALSLAALSIGYARSAVDVPIRATAAIGVFLLPVIAVIAWVHLADQCAFTVFDGIQCFKIKSELRGAPQFAFKSDLRHPGAVIAVVLLVMLGETYLSMLRRIIVKPK